MQCRRTSFLRIKRRKKEKSKATPSAGSLFRHGYEALLGARSLYPGPKKHRHVKKKPRPAVRRKRKMNATRERCFVTRQCASSCGTFLYQNPPATELGRHRASRLHSTPVALWFPFIWASQECYESWLIWRWWRGAWMVLPSTKNDPSDGGNKFAGRLSKCIEKKGYLSAK